MMKIKQLFIASLLSMSSMAAFADSAVTQLRNFVSEVQTATGSFTQRTTDDTGASQGMQQGEFAFQRPGKFRWAVSEPYEQLIVADGRYVYQYDPDLFQATRRPIDAAVGASPAAILFGSGSLEEHFTLDNLATEDPYAWLRATPKSTEAGFAHVDIAFQAQRPVQLVLLDSFGQITEITLSDITFNPQVSAQQFSFDAEEGVDVVEMD